MKISNQKNKIYSGFNIYRYSFHIQGLLHFFHKKNIIFTSSDFPHFHHHALPIIIGENPGLKIYISAGDGPGYNQEGLEWSDVYVKRTILAEEIPQAYTQKIIPMGPHHGIRVWGPVISILQALKTYFSCRNCITSFGEHLFYYLKQSLQRLPEREYIPGKNKNNYIFYASTLYPTHPSYNQYRATFINACRSTSDINFEGGLIRKDDFRVPEYEPITISVYYSPREWLEKSKQTMIGFWAPGDQGAMTLKMAEFMAFGKAIIAVPIRQEQLPAPLIHGEHIHFVDGSMEEMKDAVRLLTDNLGYRRKLEQNARKYYEDYVAPEKAILRFIREAAKRKGIVFEDL